MSTVKSDACIDTFLDELVGFDYRVAGKTPTVEVYSLGCPDGTDVVFRT